MHLMMNMFRGISRPIRVKSGLGTVNVCVPVPGDNLSDHGMREPLVAG